MKKLIVPALVFLAAVGAVVARGLHGGEALPLPPGYIASVTIYNPSGSGISNTQETFSQPFATGDVPTGNKIQIRKADNSTVIPTQEDGCSTWSQDSSRKACSVSFVEPDTVPAGGSVTYSVFSVSGTPSTTPNLTLSNITTNTNLCLKSSDLTEASGTAEAGTWDFVCLNNVLANYNQYNASTGYGSNPAGGWEYYATGPNRVGIHAFQYAKRESDGAIHDWIRTDLWVDFWGSGSNPCPCSVSYTVSQPNSYGKIASGTVGSSPEGAYVYSLALLNGSTGIYSWGGANDNRTITTLTSASFNTGTNILTMPNGNAYTTAPYGVYPVRFTCPGACPSGITAGSIYYIYSGDGLNTFVYPYRCTATIAPNGVPSCPSSSVTFGTSGSGTITMTPYVTEGYFGGFQGLDTTANRIWIGSGGTVQALSPALVGHDFQYLTQKSKATPPYLANLAGTLINLTGHPNYYPNSFYLPYNMNQTGDGPGDERIGPINHSGAYALFDPYDPNAAAQSTVIAASFGEYHLYHMDETVGQPVVWNNGPAKNGVTYTTMGLINAANRGFPFSGSNSPAWLAPSPAQVDVDPFYESYGTWPSSSHIPAPQQEPLIRSGEPEWEFGLVQEATAIMGQDQFLSGTVNGVTYWRVLAQFNEQTRGVAWGGRVLDQADFFNPANSPTAQYLHDIESDNGNWLYNSHMVSNGLPTQAASLGYYAGDVVLTGAGGVAGYQLWQDDFLFWQSAQQAWRNEYSGYTNWATSYFSKQIVGRMDSTVGGCFWGGPARVSFPFLGYDGSVITNLASTWPSYYSILDQTYNAQAYFTGSLSGVNLTISSIGFQSSPITQGVLWSGTAYGSNSGLSLVSQQSGTTGGVGVYTMSGSGTISSGPTALFVNGPTPQGWPTVPFSCPTMGLVQDVGATTDDDPSGLASFAAMSTAMGSILGVTNSGTIYSHLRLVQYGATPALTFTQYRNGNPNTAPFSYPEFAIGPLGATN